MTKLAKCPCCGKSPESNHTYAWCGDRDCRLDAPVTHADWNRLARLVRKGRAKGWLDRWPTRRKQETPLDVALVQARDWSRKRRAKG